MGNIRGLLAILIALAPAIASADGAPPPALVIRGVPAAALEIHYSPVENLEHIDVALIDEAGETIDMDAYVLTDWPVIDALAEAADRGVVIRIWQDQSLAGKTAPAELAKLTAQPNVALRIKPGGALMHLKSYCVDGKLLRTGAANFSASGEKDQDNDLVIVRDPGFAAAFEANFGRQWGAP